jgi:serine/threonine protein kinase
MMELLGRMPKNLALSGKNSKKYFDSKGNLRKISGLNYWPLRKVLTEKYMMHPDEAEALSDFLLPMLGWHHDNRASAAQMLDHYWLNMPANYDFKYTEREYQTIQLKKEKLGNANEEITREEMNELIESDPELYQPDIEDPALDPVVCKKRSRAARLAGYNDDFDPFEDKQLDEKLSALFDDSDDNSLEDARVSYLKKKTQTKADPKINNSFSGPYPVDPTEFNHNDKGANAQFSNFYATQKASKARN